MTRRPSPSRPWVSLRRSRWRSRLKRRLPGGHDRHHSAAYGSQPSSLRRTGSPGSRRHGGSREPGGRSSESHQPVGANRQVGSNRSWERTRSRRRPGRRRVAIAAALVVLGAVLVVTGAAAVRTLLHVRASVNSARMLTAQVVAAEPSLSTPAGRAGALGELSRARTELAGAQAEIRSSIPLDMARLVPGLSTQRAALVSLVSDASRATVLGRGLIDAVGHLGGPLQPGRIPLNRLASLQEQTKRTADGLGSLVRPAGGLWSILGAARRTFNTEVGSTSLRLSGASRALGTASQFLGADGPRNYLVAGENNAEMRDQGMVLSYVVLHLQAGGISVGAPGHVDHLQLSKPAPIGIPAGTQAIFGALEPTQVWQSVNAPADFAWSAKAMTAMFAQATGQHVDGVIGADVPALADLLSVTGPVSVPGVPQAVSAASAGDVLLHVLYQQEPTGSQVGRHEEIGAVAAATAKRIEAGGLSTLDLARAVGQAANGRHLQVWSADPRVESSIDAAGVSGSPSAIEPDRTFTVAAENATATKLDYYVRSSVALDVNVDPHGTVVVRGTVTLTNTAPSGQAPSYQLGPDHVNSFRPGDYVARVYWWGPAGSIQAASVAESGLRLNQTPVAVGPGQQRSVHFQTTVVGAVRHGRLTLRLVPQPRLYPANLVVHLNAPGWSVAGATQLTMPWSSTLDLHWGLSP